MNPASFLETEYSPLFLIVIGFSVRVSSIAKIVSYIILTIPTINKLIPAPNEDIEAIYYQKPTKNDQNFPRISTYFIRSDFTGLRPKYRKVYLK